MHALADPPLMTDARIALFLVLTVALMFGAGIGRAFVPADYGALAWGTLGSLSLFALTAIFLRWERRDAASIGLRFVNRSPATFAMGAAVGAVLYALHLFAVHLFGGSIRFERDASVGLGAVLLALATYLALATMEEVGFRGFLLRRLEERTGPTPAIALSAVAFAVLHLSYGWPLMAALVGASTGALLFGTAALVSRGLALPLGIHFAWNLAGWMVGEKGGASVWRLVIDPQATDRAARAGTVSYLVLLLSATAAIWLAGRHRVR